MRNPLFSKSFILVLVALFFLFGCDKKKKLPIQDDHDKILQQKEDTKETVKDPEPEGIIPPVIIGYENGILSWYPAQGSCSQDDITYNIFISTEENPTEQDFLGGYITVKNATERKVKLDFGNNDVLYIFIVAVDRCKNYSEMSEPLIVRRSEAGDEDKSKIPSEEIEKEKPEPESKNDNKSNPKANNDQDKRILVKLINGLERKSASGNNVVKSKGNVDLKAKDSSKNNTKKAESKIDKSELIKDLKSVQSCSGKACDTQKAKPEKAADKKPKGVIDKNELVKDLKSIAESKDSMDEKEESSSAELKPLGDDLKQRSDIIAFTPELAVNLALSSPLQRVKRGMFKNDTIQSCLYRNQNVLVVDGYCTNKEAGVVQVVIYSLDLGRVSIYSEPGTAPSNVRRDAYRNEQWSVSWRLPKVENFCSGSSLSEVNDFEFVETFDNLCLSNRESCLAAFRDTKNVYCKGFKSDAATEWVSNANEFWDNPPEQWYTLIKTLVDLRK